jgi:hypothetical protein
MLPAVAFHAELPHDFYARVADHLEWRDRVRLSLACQTLRAELHVEQRWRSVDVRCPRASPSLDLAEALASAGEHVARIRILCVRNVACTPYVDAGRTNLWRLFKRLRSFFPAVDSELEELCVEMANVPIENGAPFRPTADVHDLMCLAPLQRFSKFKRIHFKGAEFPLCQVAAHDLTRFQYGVAIDHVRLMERGAADYASVFAPSVVTVNLSRPQDVTTLMLGVRTCGSGVQRLVVCAMFSALLKPEHILALTHCIHNSSVHSLEFRDCHIVDEHLRDVCQSLPDTLRALVVHNNVNKRRRGLTIVTNAVGRATVGNASWDRKEASAFGMS